MSGDTDNIAAPNGDAANPTGGTPAPRVIDSERLFGPRREVKIRHRGETYRLRITKSGKLILNK